VEIGENSSVEKVVSLFNGIGVEEIIVEDPMEEVEVLVDREMSKGFVDGNIELCTVKSIVEVEILPISMLLDDSKVD
jgi:hypothetical protein